MVKILFQLEEGHLFNYEDIVIWLTFKMQELKDKGWKDEDILEYFSCEDFEGEREYIEKLKQVAWRRIS